MNKRTFQLMICLFLVAIFCLAFASCGDNGKVQKTDPVTEPVTETTPVTEGENTSVKIVFAVNGTETEVEVPVGEIPVYTGKTEWETTANYCKITGWDKEFVAATEPTTYTAVVGVYGLEVYDVLWNVKEGLLTTKVHKGETPVPPSVNEKYETDSMTYTFKGTWSPAITPVDGTKKKTVYNADYSSETRMYTVTFVLNGETVGTTKVKYNEIPVVPSSIKVPSGYKYVAWENLTAVKGDITVNGTACHDSPEALSVALSNPTQYNSALYLGIQETRYPGNYGEYILTYLRYLIAGGHEPIFDLTPNFSNPMISGAVAVAKQLPDVWSQLTPLEVEKLDYIMKCMAVHAAIATDDSCNYTSGMGGTGNYNKSWNPNYPISNVTQILFCVSYFGSGDAVNQVLKDFDYDTYIAKFTEWGWTNVLSRWTRETDLVAGTVKYKTADEARGVSEIATGRIVTNDGNGHMTLEVKTTYDDLQAGLTGYEEGQLRMINYTTPKAMLMTGGEVYCMTALYRISQYVGKSGGTGIGVPAIGQKGYKYKGFDLSAAGVEGIWNYLLNYNYSGGIVSSKEVPSGDEYLCYIYDGTNSPVQGLPGMMKEFHSGQRSSVHYCQEDFIMAEATTAALYTLGLYNPYSEANLKQTTAVWVGNTDFIYKAEHGYVSFTGTAVRGAPDIAYGSGNGYKIWKYYWLDNGGTYFSLDDFDIPDPDAGVVGTQTIEYAKNTGGSSDLTHTLGNSSGAHAGQNWWDAGNIMWEEISFHYHGQTPDFGIRLRTGSNRTDLMRFALVEDVQVFKIVDTLFTPVNESPATYQLPGYGWYRISFGFSQSSSVNEGTKSVATQFFFYLAVNGTVVGTYQAVSADDIFAKGWNLYTAVYDETQPEHIKYTDRSEVYWQFYSSGVHNDPTKEWFFEYGDAICYCAIEPRQVATVSFELNGGVFEENLIRSCPDGYKTEYKTSDVITFVRKERSVNLPTPTREGYEFTGWYTNEELTGSNVTKASTDDSYAAQVYYAGWKLAEAPIEE